MFDDAHFGFLLLQSKHVYILEVDLPYYQVMIIVLLLKRLVRRLARIQPSYMTMIKF
jgi:hypothetical protein